MECVDHDLVFDLQCLWSAGNLGIEIQTATPSSIFATQQLGDLSELSFLPLQNDLQRSRPKVGATLPDGIDPKRAGIGEIKVGANGIGLHACAPRIFGVLPEGDVGIDQCVRFFRLSDFEIDAGVGGFEIRECGVAFRGRRAGWGGGDLSIAFQ